GQIGLDQILVIGLGDVRARTPLNAFLEPAEAPTGQLARIPIEEIIELPERTPADQVHVAYLLRLRNTSLSCRIMSGRRPADSSRVSRRGAASARDDSAGRTAAYEREIGRAHV